MPSEIPLKGERLLPSEPFTSDGCSCWRDGDWVDCCVRHDLVYWMGGAGENRKQVDLELMKCVDGKGHSVIGRMMYMGVWRSLVVAHTFQAGLWLEVSRYRPSRQTL